MESSYPKTAFQLFHIKSFFEYLYFNYQIRNDIKNVLYTSIPRYASDAIILLHRQLVTIQLFKSCSLQYF